MGRENLWKWIDLLCLAMALVPARVIIGILGGASSGGYEGKSEEVQNYSMWDCKCDLTTKT